MDKISLSKATRLTSPNPVSIVCTKKPDGGTNLATLLAMSTTAPTQTDESEENENA